MAYSVNGDVFAELTRLWSSLGQEDIKCGLPGYYSDKLAVDGLSRDIYLTAREISKKAGGETAKLEYDGNRIGQGWELLKNEVFDLLYTASGRRAYGPLIWPERTANDENAAGAPSLDPEKEQIGLSWSSEADRQT